MHRSCRVLTLILFLATTLSSLAASGKVIKVLPHFLDLKGQHTTSPSLYERDAYQLELRKHPELRSGVQFDIQWKGRSSAKNQPATVRIELRGTSKGDLPTETKIESAVRLTGGSHWARLKLEGAAYKEFGEVTAWRVTVWAGDELIGEQKSFLW